MTDITSNITFDNDNGQITKCVLKITGGKTFTVTLVKGGYEVKEEGTDPCSTPGSANAGSNAPASNAPGSTPGSAPGSTPGSAPGSTPTPSAPPAPLEQEKYNTQVELIEKLVQRGYTAPQ